MSRKDLVVLLDEENTEEIPGWVQSLEYAAQQQLDGSALGPLALLEELGGWVRYSRDAAWQSNHKSLRQELDVSLPTFGPGLRRLVAKDLRSCRHLLEDSFGTSARSQVDLTGLLSAMESLQGGLSSDDALRAAWWDAVGAVQRRDASIEACQGRIQVLCDLLGARHRYPKRRLLEIVSVLRDGGMARKLQEAEARRSGAAIPPLMSIDERLAFSEAELLRKPRTARCIVWVQYAMARIPGFVETAGDTTLFWAPWAVPNAQRDDGQEFQYRGELRNLLAEQFGGWWTDEGPQQPSSFVIARVDLGEYAVESAIDRAVAIVQSIVIASTTWSGGIRWQRNGPAAVVVDGRVVSWSSPVSPRADFVDMYGLNATSDEFGRIGRKIGEALAAAPLPTELEEALRLLAEAGVPHSREATFGASKLLDERTSISLWDQAFEHVAASSQLFVTDLERRLSTGWSYGAWAQELGEKVNLLVRYTSARHSLLGALSSDGEPNSLSISAVVEHKAELLKLCNSPLERSHLRSLIRVAEDVNAYRAFIASRNRRYVSLLSRHRRVRNSIVHGNPVTRVAISSVVWVAQQRSYQAVQLSLQAFGDRTQLTAVLDDLHDERQHAEDALDKGVSLLQFWANS